MWDNNHNFSFTDNPILNIVIMVCLLSGSFVMNMVEGAKLIVPFSQICACAMTIYVGYRTIQKFNKDK